MNLKDVEKVSPLWGPITQAMSLFSSKEKKGVASSRGCSGDSGSLRISPLVEVETSPVRVIQERSVGGWFLHLAKAFMILPGMLCFFCLKGLKEGVLAFFSFIRSKKIGSSSV